VCSVGGEYLTTPAATPLSGFTVLDGGRHVGAEFTLTAARPGTVHRVAGEMLTVRWQLAAAGTDTALGPWRIGSAALTFGRPLFGLLGFHTVTAAGSKAARLLTVEMRLVFRQLAAAGTSTHLHGGVTH
jgi:hypothetical protein